jgi:hypothetical protein
VSIIKPFKEMMKPIQEVLDMVERVNRTKKDWEGYDGLGDYEV